MTPTEYHALIGKNGLPVVGSSTVSQFWNGGQCSGDMVASLGWKRYFENGNVLESMVEDRATGSEKFFETFYVSDIDSPPPESIGLAIHEGRTPKISLTPKTQVRAKCLHNDYVDECNSAPGKMPVGQVAYKTLLALVDSLMICNVGTVDDPVPASLYLTSPAFQWQVQVFGSWNDSVECKGMVDGLIELPHWIWWCDFKWSATLSNASKSMKARYWCQEQHYKWMIEKKYGKPALPCNFLVGVPGDKNTPPLAQCRRVLNRDGAANEYQYLMEQFADWDHAGRPRKGFLEPEENFIWLPRRDR